MAKSTEQLLSDAIVAYLLSDTWTAHAYYNRRNCFPVPVFVPPPPGVATYWVEVMNPSITRKGAAGGCYIEDIRVQVGVFTRTMEDNVGEARMAHSKLVEEAFLVAQRLEGYNGGSSITLSAWLWRDAQPIVPMQFAAEEGVVPGVLWCIIPMRALYGRTTAAFQSA